MDEEGALTTANAGNAGNGKERCKLVDVASQT